ncbi:deoxynucleoside kinase [Kallotenue papyrolyticum]|uniref:deoxynucleoside kinase n=1 Tax=Kallotenue papyrolyticum TaxID=1325125 RepID=UPI000492DB85|nr:deoxynucleoside kinase [Kallotenue papyrolyticum]
MPHYIVIEGVIGVGKTTLTRLLARTFSATPVLEVVEENPFLSAFYTDRERYAFQTQTFFVLSRFRQQQTQVAPLRGRSNLISDYLFAKNEIFARLNLQGDELELFEQLYGVLAERVPQPDLVVYLQADVDTLMTRIALRDRPFERDMDRQYISDLRDAYEEFFARYTATPLLTIATDTLNLVRDPQARAQVIGQIRAALAGYAQPTLLDL